MSERAGRVGRGLAAFLALAGLAYIAILVDPAEGEALDPSNVDWRLFADLTISGFKSGGIFALAGLGLVLTYKATGVFNFAFGAIGAFVAFVLWQFAEWGWPLWLSGPVAVLLAGPLIGLVLERVVFRPLEAREASVAEELVATIGVYVIIVGVAVAIWGTETRSAAALFPGDNFRLGTPWAVRGDPLVLNIGSDQLWTVATAVVLSLGLGALFTFTPLGTRVRAVVDRRELAQLTSINANRVSALAWAVGCGLAGLTGIVLAPQTFGVDAIRLPLVVSEAFAVAVIARLSSLPLAVGGGLFLGLATQYGLSFEFDTVAELLGFGDRIVALAGPALNRLVESLAVFVLFGALLLNRRLDTLGEGGTAGSLVARSTVAGTARGRSAKVLPLTVAALFVALPVMLDGGNFGYAHSMIALAIIFLSIVAITGYSGHITLGQAGFAGFGALLTARLDAGSVAGFPDLPVIPAMLIAAALCIPLGFIAGYPALKRRGLFLGLTTLALGVVLSRYVFENEYFNASTRMVIERPTLFGLSLQSDLAFYYFELVLLAGMVLLTHNLRSGRLGRILGAMRDSETAARSIGLSLRRYKLFIFSISAFMAAIGGTLLSLGGGAFSFEVFNPFYSLLWFAAVTVAGVTSIYGALLGAAILTLLEGFLDVSGISYFLVGLTAIALGQLPGGLVGLVRRITVAGWIPAGLRRTYEDAVNPPPPPERVSYELTPFALQVLSESTSGNGDGRATAAPGSVVR